VDPYEARLGAMIDLNGDGEIDQDEKDYLKDLVLSGKLKSLELLRDVRPSAKLFVCVGCSSDALLLCGLAMCDASVCDVTALMKQDASHRYQ
jgi:hypothetical protein